MEFFTGMIRLFISLSLSAASKVITVDEQAKVIVTDDKQESEQVVHVEALHEAVAGGDGQVDVDGQVEQRKAEEHSPGTGEEHQESRHVEDEHEVVAGGDSHVDVDGHFEHQEPHEHEEGNLNAGDQSSVDHPDQQEPHDAIPSESNVSEASAETTPVLTKTEPSESDSVQDALDRAQLALAQLKASKQLQAVAEFEKLKEIID